MPAWQLQDGFTPLLKAISDGNAKHTNLLLNAKHTKLLLDAGTPVNKPNEVRTPDCCLSSRLATFKRTFCYQLEWLSTLASRLLTIGVTWVDLWREQHGMTPLYYAARYNRADIIPSLIQRRADVEAQDSVRSPLSLDATRRTLRAVIGPGLLVSSLAPCELSARHRCKRC